MKTYLVLILTTSVNISEGRFIDSLNIKSVENVMCYSGADQKCSKKRKEMRSFTEKKNPNHHHKLFWPSLQANSKVGQKVLKVIDTSNFEIPRQR